MSTQQEIYVAGFKNRPPMLNKDNCVPWSSCILCYAKSKPNGKLIYNSIMNVPYVRRMIPEPGDLDREVHVAETFHEQTDDEHTKKEVKKMVADDQAIHIILMGLLEESMLLLIVERFTSTDGESIESYYHRFLKLINDFKRNKHFPKKIASNLKFLNNLQPEWRRHVTIIHQTKDLHEVDYTQLYDFLKYNQAEMVGGNVGNQFRQYVGQNVGNQNGLIVVSGIANQNVNPNRNGNVVAARADGNSNGNNGIQLQAEEFGLMEASTLGTQTDNAPVYDSDGSAEEAAKFVRDFKSLAKEADESLAKHKTLEFENERLLRQLSVMILCLLCKVILL
ncbi:hypothetical protein Tco_1243920 [Tanacetum coccineum]